MMNSRAILTHCHAPPVAGSQKPVHHKFRFPTYDTQSHRPVAIRQSVTSPQYFLILRQISTSPISKKYLLHLSSRTLITTTTTLLYRNAILQKLHRNNPRYLHFPSFTRIHDIPQPPHKHLSNLHRITT